MSLTKDANNTDVVELKSLLSNDLTEILKDRQYFEDQYSMNAPVYSTWITHPYAISTIVSLAIALVFYAFYNQASTANNVVFGGAVALMMFLIMSSFQLRDSLMVRPHPVMWRMLKGLVIVYFCFTAWLLFQDVNHVRQWLKYLSPELGVNLPEVDYGANCAIYTPENPESSFYNLKEALFDSFVISHVLGWFCKTLLMRDWKLVLMSSLLFEVYEITFKHLLPNFNECWWDSLILDIGICNSLGIIGGYHFLKYFQCKQYNFVGYVTQNGKKIWKPLAKFRNLVGLGVVLWMIAEIELNAFFLKFVLWIRASHWINLMRVVFWWLHGCAATRELYYWMENPGKPRVGIFIWLLAVNSMLESLVWLKFGKGMFPNPMPSLYFWSWMVVLGGVFLFICIYYPLKNNIQKYVSGSAATEAEGAAKKEL